VASRRLTHVSKATHPIKAQSNALLSVEDLEREDEVLALNIANLSRSKDVGKLIGQVVKAKDCILILCHVIKPALQLKAAGFDESFFELIGLVLKRPRFQWEEKRANIVELNKSQFRGK
jgi:hypothetical protein